MPLIPLLLLACAGAMAVSATAPRDHPPAPGAVQVTSPGQPPP